MRWIKSSKRCLIFATPNSSKRRSRLTNSLPTTSVSGLLIPRITLWLRVPTMFSESCGESTESGRPTKFILKSSCSVPRLYHFTPNVTWHDDLIQGTTGSTPESGHDSPAPTPDQRPVHRGSICRMQLTSYPSRGGFLPQSA